METRNRKINIPNFNCNNLLKKLLTFRRATIAEARFFTTSNLKLKNVQFTPKITPENKHGFNKHKNIKNI